jgi:hypothetical protein
MGFVTPALLAGAALIAIPIALHLIMRRESKLLKFPALRFVQQRRLLNQHRLRLRHWLLLALRCAIIALLAFALARPTLRGSVGAGKEGAAVASALVFDNSLRMQYEHDNQSRLQKAKELAAWLVNQLPADSPVTIVDRAGRQRGQDLSRDAVEMRIERLEPSAAVRPMEDALRDAARWIDTKKDFRGEVYVFTDLAAEAWPQSTTSALAKSLDSMPGANVYLIDVGAHEPRNRGLGLLKLSGEQVTTSGLLHLTTDLLTTGPTEKNGDATVELYLADGANPPEKRGQQVVSQGGQAHLAPQTAQNEPVPDAQSTPVEFSLSGLSPGTHQGVVRVVGRDALPCDDVRYFTIDVRPPSKILLLGVRADDTLFLREALAPTVAAGVAPSEFACDVRTYADLGKLRLADYAAVFLVNPPPLPDEAWAQLVDYTEAGGGVGISLGRNARREELNASEPQRLLPAKLRWQSHDTTYLRPVAVEHPALGELAGVADSAPWSEFPVFKYWELEPGAEAADTVATFANGKPGIVERQVGGGRVLMLTTSVADRASDDPWNLLPTAPDPWPFIALANGIARYLAGAGQSQLNYVAGQTVVLPLTPGQRVSSYVLQLPDSSAVRQSLAAGQHDLSIATADAPGNYRVRAGGEQDKLDRGFSVNLPPEISRLERVETLELVKALGAERTRAARTRDEIELRVGVGRLGHELFPALILAVALVLAAEQLLANRFYESVGTGTRTVNSISDCGLRIADSKQSPNPQSAIPGTPRVPQSSPPPTPPASVNIRA